LFNKGSLVEWSTGSVICREIEELTRLYASVVPSHIKMKNIGVRLKNRTVAGKSYYFFDVSLKGKIPFHDPCGNSSDNHLKGVQNPHGNIFIR